MKFVLVNGRTPRPIAYGLVVMHVALGVMQNDRNPFIPAMLASGFAIVTLLHLVGRLRHGQGP